MGGSSGCREDLLHWDERRAREGLGQAGKEGGDGRGDVIGWGPARLIRVIGWRGRPRGRLGEWDGEGQIDDMLRSRRR
jgi:hypothetical protein